MSEKPFILLVAPPFCGHLHPTLGIARCLRHDFDVVVASTEAAQPAISAAGLEGSVVLAGQDEKIFAIADPPHAVGSDPRKLDAQLKANLSLLARFKAELLAGVHRRRPALVIADFTVPVAGLMAREEGIPWWTSHASPCAIETPDGPPAYVGGYRPRSDLVGRVRDAYGRAVVRTFKRGVGFLYRKQIRALGMASIYRADGTEAVYSDERILALGRAELELPRTWPRAVELVGPVLYTPPSDAPPPPFVEGRRHVLVTLGTHLGFRKDETAEAFRRVARALPELELHFTDGHPASARRERDGNFHRLGYVPYARDLERYDLVVHHGGAGVMYHTLRHGLPALVMPTDYDQFDHAARLEEAGLARTLGAPDTWPRALRRALDDREMRDRAERFAKLLTAEPAEEKIAAAVGRLFSRA